MSFAEKLGSLMQRPNDDLASKDDSPWWLKYTARALGSIGGTLSILFGVINIILSILTFSLWGILGGIGEALLAFTVIIAEAPCCCMFVDYVQEASNWVEKRPYWHRAAYYTIGSLVLFLMNFDFNFLFSGGLIFITGLIYGSMALGRKGSRADMAAAATSTGAAPQGEHSRTLMEDPDVWRPA
ncbi:hypothetical protein V9T40_000948 [Parthenolecanium corni]|uniref:Calcium channel flower n=1 Tax=Parthenolecanium corni TaxID=536013 RepID=A0AAN9Y0X2_9HEMI